MNTRWLAPLMAAGISALAAAQVQAAPQARGSAVPQTAAGTAAPKAAAAGKAAPGSKTARKAKAKPNPAVEQAKVLLASGDHDQVEAGIQSLGLLGTADAVPPLADRVRAGLAPDLLETAIVTLMALGQPSAAPVLFELTLHRRPLVRKRAIEAVVSLAPPGAEGVLRDRLSDQDPEVRSAAAQGLGEIGAVGSIDILFKSLDHGNFEASGALGKLIKGDQLPRLLGYLGKAPLSSLGPALGEVLTRKDIGDRDKLAIVSQLQEVGTPEVKSFLGDLMHVSGDKLPAPVTRAILQAMQEIVD